IGGAGGGHLRHGEAHPGPGCRGSGGGRVGYHQLARDGAPPRRLGVGGLRKPGVGPLGLLGQGLGLGILPEGLLRVGGASGHLVAVHEVGAENLAPGFAGGHRAVAAHAVVGAAQHIE
nr:hypothetical protein [Tanacetum cinerariifolium]